MVVNVMDEDHYGIIASKTDINLAPASRNLYAYAQTEPIKLAGSFVARIKSLATGQKTQAEFLVVKGSTQSRPLRSLNTRVKLGVLHVTNEVKAKPLDRESVIERFPEVFNSLEKHNKIKAKFIVYHTVDPVVQKPHKVPYNLKKKERSE